MLEAFAWSLPVAGSLVLGSALAAAYRVPEEIPAAVAALGAGTLIAAVGLEVVPRADELAGQAATVAGLVAGAVIFLVADWLLTREESRRDFRRKMHAAAAGRITRGGSAERGESLALGIFIDGVPETAALGITLAEGDIGLALLAGIVVSNVTESYGASAFMHEGGLGRLLPVAIFAGIAGALVIALVAGATLLPSIGDAWVGLGMGVAGGAVLATVSISVIPHAFLEASRWAALAIVLGFVVGYLLR